MSTALKHWRVLYYLAWLVPVFVASFANYTVNVETNPDASWLRYLQIHLFYWMAWGVIGELAYKLTPQRLRLADPGLRTFVGTHVLMVAGVICCYSIYYWVINPSQFSGVDSPGAFLMAMYLRSGPVMFHVMNGATYLVVLGVCLVLRQSRYAREQEDLRVQLELASRQLEAHLSEARLAVLTNQIHPHFLFNAMNSIASLIAAGSKAEAYEAVTLLAGLLRKTFQYVRQPTIKLKDEVELVVTMMKIGKLRFDERLSWAVSLPDELADVAIPPFLIQPLAENALRHAVEAVFRPVHILIDAHMAAETLVITVSDDGPGASATGSGDGVGLKNLRQRLALMREHAAGIDIATPAAGGFKVSIRLAVGASRG